MSDRSEECSWNREAAQNRCDECRWALCDCLCHEAEAYDMWDGSTRDD